MNRSSHRCRSGAFLALALSACLAACGGSDSQVQPAVGYLYVASRDFEGRALPGTVNEYAIGTDGSLAAVASIPACTAPESIVSDPGGSHVYVVCDDDNTISQYAVGARGALSPLSPASVAIGGFAVGVASSRASIDPTGRYLYVVTAHTDPAGTVSIEQFSIASGGALTPLSPAYIVVAGWGPGPLAIDPSGHHAYHAAYLPGGLVSQLTIANDGTLSALTPATVAAPAAPIGVTIAPDGRTAFVLSVCVDSTCDGEVAQYAIGADGGLTFTGTATLTGGHVNPLALLIGDSGSSAYLLTNLMGIDTNAGALYQYTIIPGAGGWLADSPPSLGVSAGAVAEAAFGRQLYALSASAIGSPVGGSGGFIDRYAIGPGGLLSALGSTPLPVGEPTAMTLAAAH